MPSVPGLWLVSYDIAHPRRLQRVARLMEKSGVRVQYSVFAMQEDSHAISGIKNALSELIKPTEDDVRIYPISARGRSLMLGAALLDSDLLPHHPVFQQLRLPLGMSHTARRETSDSSLVTRAKGRMASKRDSIWTSDW